MFRYLLCSTAFLIGGYVATTAPVEAGSGEYLAGRQAALESDFAAASEYLTMALAQDPGNPELMRDVVASQLGLGKIDRALPIARLMETRGYRSQLSHMTIVADLWANERYAEYLERDADTQGIGTLVDGLLAGWALSDAADVAAVSAAFDDLAQQEGLGGFASYHEVMALASMGAFEAAEAVFAQREIGPLFATRRGALARAEILSQLGRNEEALDLIRGAFGTSYDPELTEIRRALDAGETLAFSQIAGPRDGAAEVFFSVASALRSEADPSYALLYVRMSLHLRPDFVDARLLGAELLEDLGQFDLAIEEYKNIATDHPAYHAAELGRAEALRQSDKVDASIEVLEQLAKRYPSLAIVHSTLADTLRQQDRFQEAIAAYDQALNLLPEDARSAWFLHYARAICYERIKEWPNAEADFRRALELNPGQPQVLNYLGYSLVEKQIKLDEALSMIEQAVAASPDSGYIVDSLGWVLYRLGRYDEAVVQMERAVELMPIDPVVNDHLGDVYWTVGRYREAEFQWMRALSFVDEDAPGDAQPERMRRKLEVGLDLVLEEEGAAPIQVVEDR